MIQIDLTRRFFLFILKPSIVVVFARQMALQNNIKRQDGWVMKKGSVAIIDFSSSIITVLVGSPEVNNSFKLLASVDIDYAGFANGAFIDVNSLKPLISQAIKSAEREIGTKLDFIVIGVPAEFCFCYDKLITKSFAKKTKITAKIVNSIFINDEEIDYPTHTVINKSPLFYIINDDNKIDDPIDSYATKLQVRTSYVLVENSFKMLIGGIMESLGIKNYDFLSTILAESNFLISENKRREGAILIDCGYMSTSVAQVLGDGLKDLKSFSLGGGFINSDLTRVLEIDYDEAEELKMQAVITLKPQGVDAYSTSTGKKFAVKTVNEIILVRLDKIIDAIKRCIGAFAYQLPDYVPIYITGGGINYLEGISDILRREFDRPIELIAPNMLLFRKPDLSSSISLLQMSLNLYK